LSSGRSVSSDLTPSRARALALNPEEEQRLLAVVEKRVLAKFGLEPDGTGGVKRIPCRVVERTEEAAE